MKMDLHQTHNHLSGDTLERLRVVSNFGDKDWLEILNLNWRDYTMVRSGLKELPENTIYQLADRFICEPEKLIQGAIDFQQLQIKAEEKKWEIPNRYSFATYGRRRTTITSFEYLEKYHGWRLRYDVLKHLNLSEAILTDSFAPISMQVITDAFAYLAKRQFQASDFFAMGMYSYVGNTNTIMGQYYSQLKSPREILEHMWGDCLKFFEKNCLYSFLKSDERGARIEVVSDPLVAEEMHLRHLGNQHICSLKAGMMASAPMYIGHAPARVVETSCVHRGDPSCVFEVTYAPPPYSLAYAARF